MSETKIQANISLLKQEMRAKAQHKIDFKTKPLGALGVLEEMAVQLCQVQNTLMPQIKNKALFVFASDHGICEEGVSAFPKEVTRQMVQNFLNEGAAINVLCEHHSIDLTVTDVGVCGDSIEHPNLISKRVALGTKNFAIEKAMTKEQANEAINIGRTIFKDKNTASKIDVLGLGEMGIGNTTSATAIIGTITGCDVEECTGRGTGVDDQGLEHKINVLRQALQFHNTNAKDPIEILCDVGGFEIAAMAGAALEAASNNCLIVLDGLISTAAGLIAYLIDSNIRHYFVSGHKSVEVGHKKALEYMNLNPVLDLNMRLGEGTGAALTINLVEAAAKIMCQMASFEDAGVSGKKE